MSHRSRPTAHTRAVLPALAVGACLAWAAATSSVAATARAAGPPADGARERQAVLVVPHDTGAAAALAATGERVHAAGADIAPPATIAAAQKSSFAERGGALLALLQQEAQAAPARAASVLPLWIVGAIAVEADAGLVAELRARPDVAAVVPDGRWRLEHRAPTPDAGGLADRMLPLSRALDIEPVPDLSSVTWSVEAVRAPEAWRRLGVDGSGVTVAILDSGVDYHHPLLTTTYRGYRDGGPPLIDGHWWCRSCGTGTRYPYDSAGAVGHGTHVAGIIVGGGGIGVAPGARWIAARACDGSDCSDSTVLAAMQWVLELGEAAPEVVNMSLTTRDVTSAALMRPAVDALRQAGMLVVSTTGNGPGQIGAPGGLATAIGVGASTEEGLVWRNSRWGISPWGGAKPEVVAPGAGVDSARPGGAMVRLNGTSMAAPHVSGIAALMLSAAPELSPAAVTRVLTETARGIGPRRPDGPSGWGLVDAYAAVRAVTDHGTVTGRVVREPDDAPVPEAIVRVTDVQRDPVARLPVEEDGSFAVDLEPGRYVIFVEAFGYRTASHDGIEIRQADHRVDLGEIRLAIETPRGTFSGRLVDGESGAPVPGAVAIEGAPRALETDELGFFSVQLPARTYGVRVAELGYRALEDSVKVSAGQTVTRTYRLEPAPRILLVDGDAWNYGRAAEVIAASLDRLRYVHDRHFVLDERAGPGRSGGAPDTATLARYDVVLWSSAISGPAYVRGAGALSAYLDGGGRLLLSGQDALCVDAGVATERRPCNDRARPHPYVDQALHLRVVADESTSRVVEGVEGGPLAGLQIPLNGPDSLDNQDAPDVLAVTDPLHSDLIARYGDGGGAAALVARCEAHRAVALGFGLEGISGDPMRDEVLQRLLDALQAETPERGAFLQPTVDGLIRAPGSTADFTVTLTNTGLRDTTFELMLEETGAGWPAELWSGGFVEPMRSPISLGHCASRAFGVRVTVPLGAARGSTAQPTLRVRSADGGVDRGLPLDARTPAPVLLVDGEFQGNTRAAWSAALESLSVDHDTWAVDGDNGAWAAKAPLLGDHPPAEILSLYPAVLWFVGYDFRDDGNLGRGGQRALAEYLDGGGRLLLSSEDFLWAHGQTPFDGTRLFQREYLGVASYQSDEGGAHQGPLVGAPGSLYDGLASCRLETRSGREDRSDRLTPMRAGRAALLDIFGGTVATQLRARDFRSVFLAFDAGTARPSCLTTLVDGALSWLAPLADSELRLVDEDGEVSTRRAFGDDETPRLELIVRSAGGRPVDGARIEWQLPVGTQPVSGSLPVGWRWDPGTHALLWQGDLPMGATLRHTVRLLIEPGVAPASTMTSRAELVAEGLAARRSVSWRVNAPDLGDLTKSAGGATRLAYGQEAPFFINVRNRGPRSADPFILTDTLPAGLELVPDSWIITAGGGEVHADVVHGRLLWRGRIAPGGLAALGYRARVTTHRGGWLQNVAVADDGTGESFQTSARIFVEPRLLLPWLGRQASEDP